MCSGLKVCGITQEAFQELHSDHPLQPGEPWKQRHRGSPCLPTAAPREAHWELRNNSIHAVNAQGCILAQMIDITHATAAEGSSIGSSRLASMQLLTRGSLVLGLTA